LHEQNLADALADGDTYIASAVLLDLGTIALLRGDLERAGAQMREGLRLASQLHEPLVSHWCLEALATLAGRQGRSQRLARLLGAADRLRERLGFTPALAERFRERIGAHGTIAAARAELGEAAFDAARQAGFALSADEALAEALADT
jgi:non-specific serine/threonine protein kinase